MKILSLNHGLTLERLLEEAAHGKVILVDGAGRTRFAVIPAGGADSDTDSDGEVTAIRSNAGLMDDLDDWQREAAAGSLKSLEQVRAEYEALDHVPAILASLSRDDADEILKKIGVDPRSYGMGSGKELIDHWKRCVEDLTGE